MIYFWKILRACLQFPSWRLSRGITLIICWDLECRFLLHDGCSAHCVYILSPSLSFIRGLRSLRIDLIESTIF